MESFQSSAAGRSQSSAAQSIPSAQALSAHSTVHETPRQLTSAAHELGPLQSSLFSAPNVFT
jgi:hypothetical protein